MRGAMVLITLSLAAALIARAADLPRAGDELAAQIHREIFVRTDANGAELGTDALDPLLWPSSKYLLENPRYPRLCDVLDGLRASDLSRMPPLDRALLQHDLWTVFDWTDHT